MFRKIAFLLIIFLHLVQNTNAQSGTWQGELNVMGSKLPLVFHFAKDGCTLDSPKQGAKGIATEWIYKESGDVNVSIPIIGASYNGIYDGKEIKGTFTQSGMNFPLNLSKDDIASAPKRPQTPIAPFPYTTEEVMCTCGQHTLNGTLTLPENNSSSTPVVLMVTGSGMQNRDEEILGHKPFAVIADALARNGIASMRYDDCGYSDSTFNTAAYTLHDHAKDAEKWVTLLRKRFNNVGILGHSEGGTIALILAADSKIDFAISLAGMAVAGSQTLRSQNEQILIASGVPVNVAYDYGKALDKIYESVINGQKVSDTVFVNIPEGIKPKLGELVRQLSTPYMKDFLSTDISKELSRVKCPVLAIGGTKDLQVDCKSNLDVIDRELKHSQHKVLSFDGLNHLLQHCKTGLPNEYYDIEETISPDVLTTITEWTKMRQR